MSVRYREGTCTPTYTGYLTEEQIALQEELHRAELVISSKITLERMYAHHADANAIDYANKIMRNEERYSKELNLMRDEGLVYDTDKDRQDAIKERVAKKYKESDERDDVHVMRTFEQRMSRERAKEEKEWMSARKKDSKGCTSPPYSTERSPEPDTRTDRKESVERLTKKAKYDEHQKYLIDIGLKTVAWDAERVTPTWRDCPK
jgi:hypothetical protein